MAVITYSLRLTSDGTVEIKVGHMREYVGLLFKEKWEVFDAVKYALISKGAFVSDARLTEDLYYLIWRHL